MEHKYAPPVLVSFGVTRECDLKCPHCYSDSGEKDPGELTTEEAKRVLSEIGKLGAKIVIMDGGEPALRGDLVELVAHASASGVKPVLGSNGMSLTEELVQQLLDAGCLGVAISLDGANSQTHDAFRGLEGGFDRTIQGMKNCAKLGLPFQVAPLMYQQNWGQLETIVSTAKDLNADAVEIFDYVPSGRGRGESKYELSTDQRKQIIDQVIGWQSKGDIIYRVIALPQYWVDVERKVPEEEVLDKFTRSCCAAGTRYITILPNGDIIPCMILQVVLGNVKTDSLEDVWYDSPILEELRNRDNLKGKCGRCKYKIQCAGARCKAYEMTGDMMAEDPTCWFSEEVISGE
jgi:radical SAM protein with 4Fe4S-binding SPASM domain